MSRVIAIDPGYERCGVAILEKTNGNEVLVYSECLRSSTTLPFFERLHAIGNGIAEIIEKHEPEALAMETLFFSKNQKTAMMVAEARGMITYVAASHDVPLVEYSPAAIKIAITGVGNADKKQIAAMVPHLIKLPQKKMLDDEIDAIAIGLTHLAHSRHN